MYIDERSINQNTQGGLAENIIDLGTSREEKDLDLHHESKENLVQEKILKAKICIICFIEQ